MIVQRTSSVSGVATRHRPGWSPHSFLGETRFQTVHSCSLSKKHCRFVTFRHAHTGPRWWGYFSRPSGLARGARGSRFRYALVFGQPSVGTSQQRKGKRDFRDTERNRQVKQAKNSWAGGVCVFSQAVAGDVTNAPAKQGLARGRFSLQVGSVEMVGCGDGC